MKSNSTIADRPSEESSIVNRLSSFVILVCAFAVLGTIAPAAGAQTKATPARAASADSSTPAPRLQSWTSDRVRLGLGDIVTVLIDERTLASARLNDDAADKRTKNLGLDVAPPGGPGAAVARTTATMKFDNNGDSRRSGNSTRENGFRAEMSARVIAVSPSGLIQVRGRKVVTVDKNRQEIVITGWIRPQDIAGATNTVESARLADAEVTYGQQGSLGKPKSGIISRVFGMIWP